MTRSDTPRRFSLPGAKAAPLAFVVVHRSTADEVLRRDAQASRLRDAMVGGSSG